MIRKLNINGKEYIGNTNALLTHYILGKVLKGSEAIGKISELYSSGRIHTISKEEAEALYKVTISKEEAEKLLSIDKKKITDMAIELYPNVDEEDIEDITKGLIDDIILEVFKNLMSYTQTFYENGTNCIVNVVSRIDFKKDIEIELSEKYIELCIKMANKKGSFVVSLKDSEKLKSIHSVTIYQRLMYELSRFDNNEMPKKVSINLEDLKRCLNLHGDKYEMYGDFKRRILKTSIDEINQLDYNVNFNEIKAGKKVLAIEFEIDKKEK